MQTGVFTRMGQEFRASASIVLGGNIEVVLEEKRPPTSTLSFSPFFPPNSRTRRFWTASTPTCRVGKCRSSIRSITRPATAS